MSLPNRNLDDKPFSLIVDDARALIPRVAPDWTDHNVHDPGITFVELFAWLAEIQQYRLNRVADYSLVRFLRLAGVSPSRRRPSTALLTVAADAGLPHGVFVPARSPASAVGKEHVPFETVRDTVLTTSRLIIVRTVAVGRQIDQTRANDDPGARFAPFGSAPSPGDTWHLGFNRWFAELEIHLHVELFEEDLPPRVDVRPDSSGFEPSVILRWEYLSADGWRALRTLEDETQQLSRSGRLRFENPGAAAPEDGAAWIRATLESGRYEIPPEVAEVSTNVVEIRQAALVVNEDLGVGLGVPDHVVRLSKPPLLGERSTARRFEVGDVLDWQTTIMRLARPEALHRPADAARVGRVAERLGNDARQIFDDAELNDRTHPAFREPTDAERLTLARAFDALLDDEELYNRRVLGAISLPPHLAALAAQSADGGIGARQRRGLNRAVLQAIFSDQIVSDRLEVQVGVSATFPEGEPLTWTTWERVDDFSASARGGRHYVLDENTGEIRFGNGLNGAVPPASQRIRARLFTASSAADGNLPAGQTWRFAAPPGARTARGANRAAAFGGADEEPLQDAAFRARGELRARTRAVTAEDYQELARRTPGLRIAQVHVLPGRNPKLACIRMQDHVTVAVLPYARAGAAQPPQPSAAFLATVRRHLDALRLVTTVLHVVGPTFVTVSVGGVVFLSKGAPEPETLRRAEAALNAFFDPVRGGPLRAGWPFGRAVFPSEIHALLLQLDGVEYVADISLNDQPPEQPLTLDPTAVPVAGRHALTTIRFEQRRDAAGGSRPSRPGACDHA